MRSRMLIFIAASVMVLPVCLGVWAAPGGPVASFPDFIPFDIVKTGDVAVDKVGNVYVNLTMNNGNDQIWKFSPDGEEAFAVADLGPGIAFGLAINAEGEIYAAKRTSQTGNSMVYKVGRDGNPVLLPGTDQIVWANALAFDQRGNLYITESYSLTSNGPGPGGIWRVAPGGDAELWLQDSLLTGVGSSPIGANGIAFYHGDLYVVNSLTLYQGSPKSLIVRVPIRPDGTPGQPDVWAVLQEVPEAPPILKPAYPPMGDGLALDVHGNVYVTAVTRSAVVRLNAEDRYQETIATFSLDPDEPLLAPLDAPNTIAFGTGKGARQSLFVTNSGSVKAVLGPPWPGRGLVKIEAGVPGLPLP